MDGAVTDSAPGATHRAERGGRVAAVLGFLLAVYALYWVLGIVDPHIYRVSFLLIAIVLTIVVHPSGTTRAHNVWDGLWIALTLAAFVWPLVDIDAFVNRAATPSTIDVVAGIVALLVILEATRRTTGWVLPLTAIAFLIYAVAGPLLDRVGLDLIAHRGYGVARIIGTTYMTLEGIFGVPLDVATTYIVVFTI